MYLTSQNIPDVEKNHWNHQITKLPLLLFICIYTLSFLGAQRYLRHLFANMVEAIIPISKRSTSKFMLFVKIFILSSEA